LGFFMAKSNDIERRLGLEENFSIHYLATYHFDR
jgi:hypothetical protein